MKTKIGKITFRVTMVALLAAVACGGSATAPVPTQPPPTETPAKGNPPPEEPATVVVPAPIDGDLAISFVAQDERGLAMVEKVSPIAQVGISEEEDGYLLSIVSRLPIGSSCSRFDGY